MSLSEQLKMMNKEKRLKHRPQKKKSVLVQTPGLMGSPSAQTYLRFIRWLKTLVREHQCRLVAEYAGTKTQLSNFSRRRKEKKTHTYFPWASRTLTVEPTDRNWASSVIWSSAVEQQLSWDWWDWSRVWDWWDWSRVCFSTFALNTRKNDKSTRPKAWKWMDGK